MKILDKPAEIAKIDSSNLCHKIIHMPQEILWGYEKSEVESSVDFSPETAHYQQVIIVATSADFFAAEIIWAQYQSELALQICLPEDLPPWNEENLYIFLDYLGENSKLKQLLQTALTRNCAVASIGTQANLFAASTAMLSLKLPSGKLPRLALPYTFTALIRILEEYQLIPSQKKIIKQVVASLICRAGALASHVDSEVNFGKNSAAKLYKKLPLIISDDYRFRFLAKHWQQQFHLNSKVPAFYGSIEQFSQDRQHELLLKNFDNIRPIFLKRFCNLASDKQPLAEFAAYLGSRNIEYLEFYTEGESLISEYFSLIYLGDMISCYLAILYQRDPASASED